MNVTDPDRRRDPELSESPEERIERSRRENAPPEVFHIETVDDRGVIGQSGIVADPDDLTRPAGS